MATLRYRRHGLMCPWTKLQVSSWMCFLFQSAITFTLVLPDLQPPTLEAVSSCYSSSFLAIIVCGFMSTALDPTDPSILMRQSPMSSPSQKTVLTEGPKPGFPKLCIKCEAHVGLKTKHCGVCNRCTAGFDHHCGWLNNCVGRRNYRWFVALVCSIQAAVTLQVSCGCSLLQKLLQGDSEGEALMLKHSFQEGGYMYLSCVFILVVLSAVVFCTNGFLLLFHIYLKVKHITTYEFILARRLRRAQVAPMHIFESGNINSSGGTKPDAPYKIGKESIQESQDLDSHEQSFTFREGRAQIAASSAPIVSKLDVEDEEMTRDASVLKGLSESRLRLKGADV